MPNDWQSVEALPLLEQNHLQLWKINLEDAIGSHDIYIQHLSPFELERANRLRAGQVRMQFVVARACLRFLLGNILCLPPGVVPIKLGTYGKPEMSPVEGRTLFFNVAHSRETILIALCRSSTVGVDLEYIDRETDIGEVSRSAFTPGEFRQIEQIADVAERRTAFFRCWTRKEAVVKADGRGLSLPLTSFEVPFLGPAVATAILVADIETSESSPSTWFVTDIDLGEGIAGAFAASLPQFEPQRFSFPLGVLRESGAIL